MEVLACNWTAVEIYLRCQLTYVGGPTGAVCIGIASHEIHAALHLGGITTDLWPETADAVRLMGRTAMQATNRAIASARSQPGRP